MNDAAVLRTADDYIVCSACGTQYPLLADSGKDDCKICDVLETRRLLPLESFVDILQDPRQYVPPEGQTFTTLAKLREDGFKNVWWQDKVNSSVWSVRTEPQVGILCFAGLRRLSN